MRSFLAHYFMPLGHAPDINHLRQFTTGDVRRDFFDAAAGGKYVAESIDDWLAVRPKALRLIATSKPNYHFVKTHCQPIRIAGIELIPDEVTAAAIYVMRNPFDLAPSFARHQVCDIDTAIDRMTDRGLMTGTNDGLVEVLGRWDDHIKFWSSAPGLQCQIIRYEDMLAKPGKTFDELLSKFLKIRVDKPKLARAIKSTSFKAMRNQEEQLGFIEKHVGMEKFFAKGEAGVWREDLTPNQVARIRKEFLPTLEKWYPEMLDETESFAIGADDYSVRRTCLDP